MDLTSPDFWISVGQIILIDILLGGDNAVVIAMGPWSNFEGLPPVYGLKGHSLVFRTGDAIPAEALFLEYQEAGGEVLTPEIFPRADGTVWACAISSTAALPRDPADVVADDGALDEAS